MAANRGEIAVRITRAGLELGLKTVSDGISETCIQATIYMEYAFKRLLVVGRRPECPALTPPSPPPPPYRRPNPLYPSPFAAGHLQPR